MTGNEIIKHIRAYKGKVHVSANIGAEDDYYIVAEKQDLIRHFRRFFKDEETGMEFRISENGAFIDRE